MHMLYEEQPHKHNSILRSTLLWGSRRPIILEFVGELRSGHFQASPYVHIRIQIPIHRHLRGRLKG